MTDAVSRQVNGKYRLDRKAGSSFGAFSRSPLLTSHLTRFLPRERKLLTMNDVIEHRGLGFRLLHSYLNAPLFGLSKLAGRQMRRPPGPHHPIINARQELLYLDYLFCTNLSVYDNRSKKQPNTPFRCTMRTIGATHKASCFPDDAINYLATSESMIAAAQHRASTH